jgi:hypothetical protein
LPSFALRGPRGSLRDDPVMNLGGVLIQNPTGKKRMVRKYPTNELPP